VSWRTKNKVLVYRARCADVVAKRKIKKSSMNGASWHTKNKAHARRVKYANVVAKRKMRPLSMYGAPGVRLPVNTSSEYAHDVAKKSSVTVSSIRPAQRVVGREKPFARDVVVRAITWFQPAA
jgi:hypothetical protein